MTTSMTLDELMTTPYEDLPMEVKHQVLGEAAYYLDRVVETGTIPGIQHKVVPTMHAWCSLVYDPSVPNSTSRIACLAGIWYMCRAGVPMENHIPKLWNVIGYINKVRIMGLYPHTPTLVGLDLLPDLGGDQLSSFEVGGTQQRMHYLMEHLPTMKATYEQLLGT